MSLKAISTPPLAMLPVIVVPIASEPAWNGRESGFPLKGKSPIAAGDKLRVRYPGGGGYGDPRTRDPALVRADLAAGRISESAARTEYGL